VVGDEGRQGRAELVEGGGSAWLVDVDEVVG